MTAPGRPTRQRWDLLSILVCAAITGVGLSTCKEQKSTAPGHATQFPRDFGAVKRRVQSAEAMPVRIGGRGDQGRRSEETGAVGELRSPLAEGAEVVLPQVPAGTRVLGMARARVLRTRIGQLARVFFKMLRIPHPSRAIFDLYGLDVESVRGWCWFVLTREGNGAFVCERGVVRDPVGQTRFQAGPVQGHVAPGGIYVGAEKDGRVVVADSRGAIEQLVLVFQKQWPPLSQDRSSSQNLAYLMAADPFGETALFFLDPDMAWWCRARIPPCSATALFASWEGGAVVVSRVEDPKAVPAAQGALMRSLASLQQALQPLLQVDQKKLPIEEGHIKTAELLQRSARPSVRGDRLVTEARGNPYVLAALLHPRLLARLFLPPVSSTDEYVNARWTTGGASSRGSKSCSACGKWGGVQWS